MRLVLLAILLFIPFNSYAAVLDTAKEYPTDEDLKQLAIEKGIIPGVVDDTFIDQQAKEENTIVLWITMPNQEKATFINSLKEDYSQQGIIIRNPSLYYVDQINNVIYYGIKADGKEFCLGKGRLRRLFETIAVQEGDYDYGKSKVETLRDYLGDEKFKWYIEKYPDKSEHLSEMDREAQ